MTPCAYTSCPRSATWEPFYGAALCRMHLFALNRLAVKQQPDAWERQELGRYAGVRV